MDVQHEDSPGNAPVSTTSPPPTKRKSKVNTSGTDSSNGDVGSPT